MQRVIQLQFPNFKKEKQSKLNKIQSGMWYFINCEKYYQLMIVDVDVLKRDKFILCQDSMSLDFFLWGYVRTSSPTNP